MMKRGLTRSASAQRRLGDWFYFGPNRVIAKDVKSCTYCYYVRCAKFIIRVEEIPCSQICATHCHAQLGLPDNVHAIKWLIVCYVV